MSIRRDCVRISKAFVKKVCVNHSDRVATHQLLRKVEEDEMFYCQKCSIKLASQGKTVLRLNPTPLRKSTSLKYDEKPKKIDHQVLRTADIERFLMEIRTAKHNLQNNTYRLQQYLIRSECEFSLVFEAINQYFNHIQEILQLQKYQIYNNILNKRSSEQADARSMKADVSEQIEDLQAIAADIQDNFDEVLKVENCIFNQIMGGYIAKLNFAQEIHKQASNIKKIHSFNINFPQIPKKLQTLSKDIKVISPEIISHLNVYRIETKQTQNQINSLLSKNTQKKLGEQKLSKSETPQLKIFSKESQGDFTLYGSSFDEQSRYGSFRHLNFENEMFRGNSLGGTNKIDSKYLKDDERKSQQSLRNQLKQRSLISEAETLLIS